MLPKLRVCSCCRSATTDYITFNCTLQNSIVPVKDSKRVATTLSPCLYSWPSSLFLSLSFVCVLAVDLRPQCIQSHSSNSIITATDSKHVATTLSLSPSPSLFLSLFLLLIDLQPQRIESHSFKTPLSCTTDSKSHRENTYRKRPEKSLWRIISQVNCKRKLQRYITNSFFLCLSLLASPVCYFSQWSSILFCRCCNCCRLSQ